MAAAARSATVRLASAATGRRAMSTAVKDMGGAIKPILNTRNNVKQNMAFYQAPGVGTIDVHPTFLKGTQDGVVIPVVLASVAICALGLGVSGVSDLLSNSNKREPA